MSSNIIIPNRKKLAKPQVVNNILLSLYYNRCCAAKYLFYDLPGILIIVK